MVGSKRKEIFFFVKTKRDCISAQTYCVLVAVGGLICLVFMKGITDLCVCPKAGMWKWVKRGDGSFCCPSRWPLSWGVDKECPFPAPLCLRLVTARRRAQPDCWGHAVTCWSMLAALRVIPGRWNQAGTRWCSHFNIRNFLGVTRDVLKRDGWRNALQLFPFGLCKALLFVLNSWLFAVKTTGGIVSKPGGCRTEHTALNVTSLFGYQSPVRGWIKQYFSFPFFFKHLKLWEPLEVAAGWPLHTETYSELCCVTLVHLGLTGAIQEQNVQCRALHGVVSQRRWMFQCLWD